MNISMQDDRQYQHVSSTLDDIPSYEDSNIVPSSQAYLLGSQDLEQGNSKEESINLEEEEEAHENSVIVHEVNSPNEAQTPADQQDNENYEAETPMQTEYTSDDTDVQYQYEFVDEPVNPVERVEEISETKMKNLKVFLILNFSANLLGFLTQTHFLPYSYLFLLVFLAIAYMTIKAIRERSENGTLAGTKFKIFRVTNWVCLGLFSLMVILKQTGGIENLSPWTIPGCLSIFLESFYLSSTFSSGEKGLEISLKYAIWVQIFLIALKVDGANLPWSFTLFVFISFGFVSLMVALILFIICASSMFGVPCYNSTGRTAIIGSGWYFLISLSNVLWGIITLHTKNLLISQETSTFLLGLFSFGLVYGGCLLYFTKHYYDTLFLFLKYEALHDLQEAGQLLNFNTNRLVSAYDAPRYKYLAKITSTYFSTIQRSFQIKDRAALLNWNKEMKRAKFYKFFPHRKSKFVSKSNRESPCVIPKATRSTSLGMEGINLKRTGKIRSQMSDEEMFSPCMELRCHKIVYSFDDRDVFKKVKRPGEEALPTEEKDLCIVCYESEPNAVIMDCGHGGVCYNCAIKSWENSDKCHMCRGDIRTILKVKNLPLIKVVKVLDETEKIIQQQPQEIVVV